MSSDSTNVTSPTADAAKSTSPIGRTSSDKSRRSSGGLFENLLSQKRSPDNVAYSQRRESIEEQSTARKGVFGKMWDSAVRGVAPPPAKE